jgi:hypothetical protein
LGAAVNFFWLASRHDGLYGSDGSLIVKAPKAGAFHADIGREIDCFAAYNVSPAVAFGAGIGHLYTGRFLKENTPGGPVTYPYLMMEYKF